MKKVFYSICILFFSYALHAQADSIRFSDLNLAKIYAADHDRPILMIFAGSDWCLPCKKFKQEVLDNTAFIDYAVDEMVVLYLDFPAHKKNQLSVAQKKHNEQLADQYNPYGAFPAIILLDKDENILGELEYKHQKAEDFIEECRQILTQ